MMMRSLASGPSVACRGARPQLPQRGLPLCRARSGQNVEEPFNEGAAQVRRLVQRDRKELLGNAADILDKYKTEFGDGAEEGAVAAPAPVSSSVATAAPSSSSPFAPSSSSSSPFAAGGAGAASPFGAPAAGAASPFGAAAPSTMRPSRLASVEPKGLTPDMSPDPIVAPPKDTRSWLAKITITQVVSVLAAAQGHARRSSTPAADCRHVMEFRSRSPRHQPAPPLHS
ncbi:MAG: hypothetical protein J3K34DRAFT_16366 [Monoraphidium minutum]|nr:MAG: hypothetical protein J3K34DRAFT_16366 [Monoraphidium minutum]